MFGSPWGQPFAIIFPLMIAFMVGIINFIIGIVKDVRNSTILPVVVDPKFTNFDRPPLQSEIRSEVFTVGKVEKSHSATINHI